LDLQIYELTPLADRDEILEQLRLSISKSMGVSLVGNRLTVRWRNKKTKQLVQVHMIIAEVDDGKPEPIWDDK